MRLGYVRKGANQMWEVVDIRLLEDAPGVEYHEVIATSLNPTAIEAAIRLLGIHVLTQDEMYERLGNVIKLGR